MYVPLSAAVDGATAEPPPHADKIASATIAPAYFTKAVVFNYGSPFRVDMSALYFSTETALRCDLPQPAKIAAAPIVCAKRAKIPMSDASRKLNGRAANDVRRCCQLSQRGKRLRVSSPSTLPLTQSAAIRKPLRCKGFLFCARPESNWQPWA